MSADKQDDKGFMQCSHCGSVNFERITIEDGVMLATPTPQASETSEQGDIEGDIVITPQSPPKQHSTVEELADWIIHTPSYTQADLETQILSYFQQTVLEARLDEAETLGAFNGRMKTKVTKDSLWSHGYNDAVAEWKAHTKTRLTDLKAKQERN